VVDDLDKKIIHYLQGDLPLITRPFSIIAGKVGISEEELIERIRGFKERGVLRRLGASLNHQRVGFQANAMVAWFVPEERIVEVGYLMANVKEVSHCYQRRPQGDWKYNLFSMIHGKSKKECKDIVTRISEKIGIKDVVILFTRKEYKKASPVYF
jgi:DNA-binding Lrp family transcriptional regulator